MNPIQLTESTFDEWLKASSVENPCSDDIRLVLTDYENVIEVNINSWMLTESPFKLTKEQAKKIFDVVEEFEREDDESDDYYNGCEHGIFGWGY